MQVNEKFFNILWPIPFFFHCSAFYADCYFFTCAHDSLMWRSQLTFDIEN